MCCSVLDEGLRPRSVLFSTVMSLSGKLQQKPTPATRCKRADPGLILHHRWQDGFKYPSWHMPDRGLWATNLHLFCSTFEPKLLPQYPSIKVNKLILENSHFFGENFYLQILWRSLNLSAPYLVILCRRLKSQLNVSSADLQIIRRVSSSVDTPRRLKAHSNMSSAEVQIRQW